MAAIFKMAAIYKMQQIFLLAFLIASLINIDARRSNVYTDDVWQLLRQIQYSNFENIQDGCHFQNGRHVAYVLLDCLLASSCLMLEVQNLSRWLPKKNCNQNILVKYSKWPPSLKWLQYGIFLLGCSAALIFLQQMFKIVL